MASYTVELPSGRRPLQLGKRLGEGAAGSVYQLPQMRGYAAKIYKDLKEAAEYEEKIAAMLQCVPDLPPVGDSANCHQIAWPATRIFDGRGAFIGFTMPEIDFHRSRPLESILQKNSRRADGISERYELRVVVAANLATVFTELHRLRHHMIDMKPDNLRFYPDFGYLAVVDTDGFSIRGARRFPSHQFTDNYIAPEGQGRGPEGMGIGQDLFALAVILFQLLNNGLHPYGGVVRPRSGLPSDLQSRIYAHLYAYGRTPHDEISPSPMSLHEYFDDKTRLLFDRAFLAAGGRPTAREWRDHLRSLLRDGRLIGCRVNPGDHAHFGKGCGLCAVEKKLQLARARKASAASTRASQIAVTPSPRQPARSPPPPPPPVPAGKPAFASAARPAGIPWGAKAAAVSFGLLIAFSMVRSCIAQLGTTKVPVNSPTSAASGHSVSWFVTAADYVVTPKAGISRVNVRSGPGIGYASLLMLPRGEAVTGRGSATAGDGETWIFVRTAGGTEGFMADKVLRLRNSAPARTGSANPSFSCTGYLNRVEQAICKDDGLAAKDRQVAELYGRVLRGSSGRDREEAVDVQRNWVEDRDRCGGSGDVDACIHSSYDSRIGVLSRWEPPARTTPEPEPEPEPEPVATPTPAPAVSRSRAPLIPPAPAPAVSPASGIRKNSNRGGGGRPAAQPAPDSTRTVTCLLPSGAEARMTRDRCRQNAGVIFDG